jgi:hypothetical protein
MPAVDHAPRLNEKVATPPGPRCPDCRADLPALPAPATILLESLPLCRCVRCGRRAACEPASRPVGFCESCQLAYLVEEDDDGRCAPCREPEAVVETAEGAMVVACEAEARSALAGAWSFVREPGRADYLSRVYRGLPDAPATGGVALVREETIRSLALPSGVVILSTGALESLKDEAQLAFLLSHELAHVASGAVATRWVRAGMRLMTLAARPAAGAAWVEAALDIARIGYGDAAEHAADERAAHTVTGAGYDLASAEAYLVTLGNRIGRGERAVAELALAQPPPADRLRRLQTLRRSRLPAGTGVRNNREVFRRATGQVAADRQVEVEAPFPEPYPPRGPAKRLRWWLFWAIVVGTLIAGGIVWGPF